MTYDLPSGKKIVWEFDLLLSSLQGLTTGHFAADVTGDCILLKQKGHSSLLLADGTLRGIGFRTESIAIGVDKKRDYYPPVDTTAWDYDRDGVDDILVHGIRISNVVDTGKPRSTKNAAGGPDHKLMTAFNLAGEFLGNIAADTMDLAIAVDFDGDGWDELVCAPILAVTPVKAPVFGKNGKQIGSLDLLPRGLTGLVSDIDGDGKQEFVRYETTTRQLRAYWPSGNAQDVFDCTSLIPTLSSAISFDGGPGKIFSNGLQLLDPVVKELISLESTAALDNLAPGTACVTLPDGHRVAVIQHGGDGFAYDKLSFFLRDGKRLGTIGLNKRITLGLLNLEAEGRSHIIAITERALLIYP